MTATDTPNARFVADAFWIVLGRAASPTELRDELRNTSADARRVLLMRLLSSPEADRLRRAWKGDAEPSSGADLERGLRSLGSDDVFVARAYDCVLGRPADAGGLRHYTGALASGDSRSGVVRSLALSEEFDR